MINKDYDLIIVGGGPAGLAAAISARKNGIEKILVLERDNKLGGILNQCIHNGFGLHRFKEELTGPEYANRFIEKLKELDIEYKLNSMVLDIDEEKNVSYVNEKEGLVRVGAKVIILAMGCRERPRGAINIPGSRPSGIFTAGTAQYLVNMEGFLPGKKVIIIGSGDIGLIMARRMTLEGAKVLAAVEVMPFSGGLKRNIVQCLDDFEIPLLLSHTVTEVFGKERLEGVKISEVDEFRNPIEGTEKYYDCDCLLLSVGLLPENELSKNAGVEISKVTSGPVVRENLETNIPGIFACGNVLHVHDLVDFVSEEAEKAGRSAAEYIGKLESNSNISQEKATDCSIGEGLNDNTHTQNKRKKLNNIVPDSGVRYTVPSLISFENIKEEGKGLDISFRAKEVYKEAYIVAKLGEKELYRRKKKNLAPGEMEKIILKNSILKEVLKDLDDKGQNYYELDLKISIEEVL